ncbi:MAG: tetratricopeptide repeat protein [Lachnospiraceae bacterium]|nr:tetratricopeptide repeat protein [Lachnospiraceae bacterium]
MAGQIIEQYRIISTKQLIKAIKDVDNNSERFCFILGSGASVSSGIPAGGDLERKWMEEMERDPGLAEVYATAAKLQADNLLDHEFNEIEEAWQEAKKAGTALSSEYYFDLYKLRFFPNHRNGYHYLEKIMTNAKPSFGYHPLALMLTEAGGNNLVITTNFDSLVEDALFMYTDSKPLVINHELLADFAGDPNIKRPIIAKVHRGIFFDPLNRPEEINELKGKWHDVLVSVFQSYTPIVIGYGGGDNSLMELLLDENVKMKNGIYWCYVEEYGLPSEKIQALVQKKKGHLVCTAGFDAVMLAIGNAMFADKIGVHETEQYLNDRTNTQIENYEKEYKRLTEYEEKINTASAGKEDTQSNNEFKQEIEKIENRGTASENEREQANQMTAWDYWRQGNRYSGSKDYASAVECYTNAIIKQPGTAVFYNNRGVVYGDLNKHQEAISDYNKAIELNPSYELAYYNRGTNYNDLGEYERAINDFNKAIELNPDNESAYNNRGVTYNNLGEYEKAINDYNKTIELKPNLAIAYSNRGEVYNNLGKYEKAIADCNKAIELDPDVEAAYGNRGDAHNALGKYEKAIADYNKAIELDPQYRKAYLNRAKVYRLLGKEEQASADEATAAKL